MPYKAIKSLIVFAGIALIFGCTELPRPFQHSEFNPPSSLTMPIDGGGIRLVVDTNVKGLVSKNLTNAIVKAMGKANIPVSTDREFIGKYLLTCRLDVKDNTKTESQHAKFTWQLVLYKGKKVGEFDQLIQVEFPDWLNADPGLIDVIALDASQKILAFLDHSPDSSALGETQASLHTKTIRSENEAIAYHLLDITGVPGNGIIALKRSLKYLLEKDGKFKSSSRKQAKYILKGVVNAELPVKVERGIRIVWMVSNEHEKLLGRVTQGNTIGIPFLEKHWVTIAFDIAKGANAGIRDLIWRDLMRR